MNKELALKEIEKVNGTPVEIGEKAFDNGDYLEIFEWDSVDGEYWGYVRDDAAGITVVTCFESGEDEETVAAWNVDFSIAKHLKRINKKTMSYLLKIAKDRGWNN